MNLDQQKKNEFKQVFRKRCFKFSLSILELSEKLKTNRTNWPLLDQVVRSGTSIGANVVEGGNSTSLKEFINYFNISLKSASETIYWLSLLSETNPTEQGRINLIISECSEIKKLLSTIILNTKSKS